MSVSLDQIKKPIMPQIAEFNDFVRASFEVKGQWMLSSMLDYILSSRGKGIRPLLVMLCAAATSRANSFGKRTYLAAMLIEMIHVASLVHDDVIDESDKRRGNASVNAKWQSHNAVIIGDYILAKNMDIGLKSGQFDLLNHIIGRMTSLCEGEILQSQHANAMDTSREDYLDIIYRKTACLFETSASAGAMSVGASPDIISRMQTFGRNLGMAFQMVDDILDYSLDKDTGKPSGNDLKEQKITLPLIEYFDLVSEDEKKEILSLIPKCAEDDAVEKDIINRVISKGAIEKAKQTLNSYIQAALVQLAVLPTSEYVKALMDVCTFVAEREK